MPLLPSRFRRRMTWPGLLLPLLAVAQSVNVSVDVTQVVRTVDERILGLNATAWDPQVDASQTISLLQAAGVRAIRIPGGSLSDEYHWATNTSLAYTWNWPSSVPVFSRLTTALGAQVVATVNYGTGTPEEAAAWVAYANASATLLGSNADVSLGRDANGTDWKTAGYWSALRASAPLAQDDGRNFLRLGRATPIGIKSWEVGNECYGSWETDAQAVPHDPYTYAVRTRDYLTRMKAVDAGISVGVVGLAGEDSSANNTSHPATNPRTGKAHNGWTPVLLATLRSLGVTPDFLVDHRYEQAPGAENDASLLQSARTWGAEIADLRQQLTDYLGVAGARVELLVTENNSVYADPGKQSTSVVNGLYLADSVGQLLQTEANGLFWWDLRNGAPTQNGRLLGNLAASLYGWRLFGDYGILSSPVSGGPSGYFEPYPAYYSLKQLHQFAASGDQVLKVTSSSSLLAVYACKRADGTLRLLVLNKDPSTTLTANFALTGFTAGSAVSYSYGPAQDSAARTGSGSTDLATGMPTISGAPFSLTFEPYTTTVLVLTAGTPAPAPAPSPTPAPAPAGSGGGGGGGAPSVLFLLLLPALATARRWQARR